MWYPSQCPNTMSMAGVQDGWYVMPSWCAVRRVPIGSGRTMQRTSNDLLPQQRSKEATRKFVSNNMASLRVLKVQGLHLDPETGSSGGIRGCIQSLQSLLIIQSFNYMLQGHGKIIQRSNTQQSWGEWWQLRMWGVANLYWWAVHWGRGWEVFSWCWRNMVTSPVVECYLPQGNRPLEVPCVEGRIILKFDLNRVGCKGVYSW